MKTYNKAFRVRRLIRVIIAEKLLYWALRIIPKGTQESLEIAVFLHKYATNRLAKNGKDSDGQQVFNK